MRAGFGLDRTDTRPPEGSLQLGGSVPDGRSALLRDGALTPPGGTTEQKQEDRQGTAEGRGMTLTTGYSVPIARYSLQWWSENVGKPAANTALIDPYNAISSSLSGISRSVGGPSILKDCESFKITPGNLISPEWFAQNIASGLAAIVPYAIAGAVTRKGLTSLASRFEAESAAAAFCKHKSTAMILGATIYDGMRKPEQGQTRIGNALGATAGFSFFEYANHRTAKLSGAAFVGSRMLIGALGATGQHTLSHIIASGKVPEGKHLLNAALSGSMMNLVLPKVNDVISGDSATTKALKALANDQVVLSRAEASVRAETTPAVRSDGAVPAKPGLTRVPGSPETLSIPSNGESVVLRYASPPKRGSDAHLPLAATEGTHLFGDNVPRPPLETLTPRLKSATPDQVELRTPRAEWIENPREVAVDVEQVPARSYETDLGVRIVVPERYAQILDKVREYRQACERNPDGDHAQLAKDILGEHTDYATRALPEDFLPALERIPDRNKVRLILTDWSNPEDVINRKLFNDPFFCSTAVAEPNGDITFFQRSVDNYISFDTTHEFGHVWWYQLQASTQRQHQLLPYLFDLAYKAEPQMADHGRKRAGHVEEAWCISLEDMLGQDKASFERILQAQPVKSAVLGRALREKLLIAEQSGTQSNLHDVWVERARQMEAQLPRAQAELAKAAPGDPAALQLLIFIGEPSQLSSLRGITKVDLSGKFAADEHLAKITAIPSVAELNLAGASLSALAYRYVGKLKGLESLDLSRTTINDQSMAVLGGLPRLRRLNLSGTAITEAGLGELATLPALQEVVISGTRVKDASRIAPLLPQVKIKH